jgi:uroporphyrinogen-III synthase
MSHRRFGLRALVTRPREDAGGLAAALAARGIEAVIEPLIDIRFRTDPAPDLAGAQAILCTSANGVRALARLSTERALPLFAVGDATAARARAEGFIEVESAGGDVADLARLVRQCLRPATGRLVHVAGSAVAGDLASDLGTDGFTVDRLVLYEARPAAALSVATVQALGAGLIRVALFLSPRTAATFVRLADRAGVIEALDHTVAISISSAADAALGGVRFRERRVAVAPTQAALLGCSTRCWSNRRRTRHDEDHTRRAEIVRAANTRSSARNRGLYTGGRRAGARE